MQTKAEALVDLFSRMHSTHLIRNLSATLVKGSLAGKPIPVSISNKEGKNHYFVSPTAAYVDYAVAQLGENQGHFSLRKWAFCSAMKCLRPLIRLSGLDHQVQINNWLTSTCPAPDCSQAEIMQLREQLVKTYPDRAIVMRSLNRMENAELLSNMRSAGFRFLPTRWVHIQTLSDKDVLPKNMRKDRKLFEKSNIKIKPGSEFTDEDFQKAKALYDMLYLDRYSSLNPDYTANFLKEMTQSGVLETIGLVTPEHGLVGWVSNLSINGTTCTPIAGYDTGLPKKMGLYRIMNWVANQSALKAGERYNMSAGASDFKQRRGGKICLEYSMVYVDHLPAIKRMIVSLMARGLMIAVKGKMGPEDIRLHVK